MKKQTPPILCKSVQVDKRATEMVAQLALDEKIGQMTQSAESGGQMPERLRGALRDGRAGSVKLITK